MPPYALKRLATLCRGPEGGGRPEGPGKHARAPRPTAHGEPAGVDLLLSQKGARLNVGRVHGGASFEEKYLELELLEP